MSGNFSSRHRFLILPNKNKQNEKSPAAYLFLVQYEETSSKGSAAGKPDLGIAATPAPAVKPINSLPASSCGNIAVTDPPAIDALSADMDPNDPIPF